MAVVVVSKKIMVMRRRSRHAKTGRNAHTPAASQRRRTSQTRNAGANLVVLLVVLVFVVVVVIPISMVLRLRAEDADEVHLSPHWTHLQVAGSGYARIWA
jgi:heme/copper-type cytochrome/quinol oxidase subunit 2